MLVVNGHVPHTYNPVEHWVGWKKVAKWAVVEIAEEWITSVERARRLALGTQLGVIRGEVEPLCGRYSVVAGASCSIRNIAYNIRYIRCRPISCSERGVVET